MFSPAKYYGRLSQDGQEPLHWSDQNDVPFRGDPPLMMRDEEAEQVPVVADAHSEILTLPDQQARYDEIHDLCINGLGSIRKEIFSAFDDQGRIRVFLAWYRMFRQSPAKSQDFLGLALRGRR